MLRRSRSDASGPEPVQLDGFESLEPIGSGGYSRVYRGRQVGFDREVALKVLSVGIETAAQQKSFERECRAMGSLSEHPNIVTVFHALVTQRRQPCIVMEYYGGGTLGDRVRSGGPIDVGEVLSTGVQICGALQTSHDRGVVHRDIKPQNLFLSGYGQPALGDFGISSFDDDRTITGAGGGLTVHYAPPELIEGEIATPASDIYSLAATLYTLASGERPYPRGPGQSVGELARRILIEPVPRLREGNEAEALSGLLAAAMSKRPEQRPASAAAFGRALQTVQAQLGHPVTHLPLSGDGPSSLAPVQPGPLQQATAPPAPVQRALDDSGTVVRNEARSQGRQGSAAPDIADRSEPATRRRVRAWAMTGVAGAAVVGVVLSASLLSSKGSGGGSDAGTEIAERPATPTTDVFFSSPEAPADVSASAAVMPDGEPAVAISWVPHEDVLGYQVEWVESGLVEEVVNPPVSIAVPADLSPCFVVRTVGNGGKLSAASEVICVP